MRKEIQDGKVRLSGCLGERYIGCGMREGVLHVEGTPGNALACYLDGGTILVDGNAQDAVADTMNAGLLAVRGSAGDALAYGMRGGCVYILGDAGYRAGVHMKAYEENRSTLVVGGRTGSFLGEYLAGGLIVVLGLGYEGEDVTGFFCGNGMYAGTIYLRTAKAPVNLSDKLVLRHVDEKEREALSCVLSSHPSLQHSHSTSKNACLATSSQSRPTSRRRTASSMRQCRHMSWPLDSRAG